jgi:hypothetical protein
MRTKFIHFAAALFTVATPIALQAQNASVLGAGTRVRLTSSLLAAGEETGKIVDAASDTITFRADARPITRALAVSDITSIEVSGGKHSHRGRDALYGAAIGGAAGALLGAASYKKPDPQSCWFFCETRSGDAIGGAVLGGLTGTLIGAFIVGSRDKTERWIPLRKTASIYVAPGSGGMNVGLSHAF